MTNNQMTEAEFLRDYNPRDFERPNTSVDLVIFTMIKNELNVLLINRAEHPFKGVWSLVGGFIDLTSDNDLEATAKRKLEEKTGIKTPYLEQFETIGNKTRDPRGWSITTVYFALLPHENINIKSGAAAFDIKWAKISDGVVDDSLAFDHAEILRNCLHRLRSKTLYSSLPLYLMGEKFTLGESQKVYETIYGKKIDHKSFRRRMLSANLLDETTEMRHEAGRPALLYKIKPHAETYYFLRTMEGAS